MIMESTYNSYHFLFYLFIFQIAAYINWFCLIPNELEELWISFSKNIYRFLRIHKIFEGIFFFNLFLFWCYEILRNNRNGTRYLWNSLAHSLVAWSKRVICRLFVDSFSVKLQSWNLSDLEKFCIWWSNSDWSLEDFSLITATACFRHFILGLFVSLNV